MGQAHDIAKALTLFAEEKHDTLLLKSQEVNTLKTLIKQRFLLFKEGVFLDFIGNYEILEDG